MSKTACTCPSTCRCWDTNDRPGLVLGCGCRAARHDPPTGCRYQDDVDGWVGTWRGFDGAAMVCMIHGGRAPSEAYENPDTDKPCLDSHLPYRPQRRTARSQADQKEARMITRDDQRRMGAVSRRSLELAVFALENAAQTCQAGASLRQRRGLDPLAREYLIAAEELERVLAGRGD